MQSHSILRNLNKSHLLIKLSPAHSLPLQHVWLAVDGVSGNRVFSSDTSSVVSPTQSSESLSNDTNPLFDGEEQDKVNAKLRRTRISSSPSNGKDPERLELPDGLKILWSPTDKDFGKDFDVPTPDLPPPEILEEALDNLLITLHPKNQHRAAYPSRPSGRLVEPTLGLYCPIEGSDNVVDMTVGMLASRTGSEFLVLDAVQLAAGEWGDFGKGNLFIFPTSSLGGS